MGRKRTREEILEQMHPDHSKMERFIGNRLLNYGIASYDDMEFCLEKTIPDRYIPKLDMALYFDGPPHQGREDRDELLREKLAKRHRLRVYTIKYRGISKAEKERVWGEVKEILGIE